MKNEPQLGKLIEGDAFRDAIHIAIAPVVAGEKLFPGDKVGFREDGLIGKASKNLIGVVDPFLNQLISKGDRFYLFLYPKTITGLRHVWEHPSFPLSESMPEPCSKSYTDKLKSEMWLRDYVLTYCPYDEDKADGGYSNFLKHVTVNRWIYYHGSDCHSLSDVEDAEELFRHLSVILGKRIDASYFEAFTCSC